jgi:hypothetical protein
VLVLVMLEVVIGRMVVWLWTSHLLFSCRIEKMVACFLVRLLQRKMPVSTASIDAAKAFYSWLVLLDLKLFATMFLCFVQKVHVGPGVPSIECRDKVD